MDIYIQPAQLKVEEVAFLLENLAAMKELMTCNNLSHIQELPSSSNTPFCQAFDPISLNYLPLHFPPSLEHLNGPESFWHVAQTPNKVDPTGKK